MELNNYLRVFLIRAYAFFFISKENRSKVIYYHDIHSKKRHTTMSTSIELFKIHIDIIKESGYEIVHEITKKYGQIEICFDDGFLGLYENIEFLKRNNIPVHLFVVSSYLMQKGYINEKQLIELNKTPLLKISSHTHTHKRLNEIATSEIEIELKTSKEIIESVIKTTISALCYPEGRFNKEIINIAQLLGYSKQYSCLPGFFSCKSNNDIIRRSLVQSAKEKEFRAILKGGDHILYFWYIFKYFRR